MSYIAPSYFSPLIPSLCFTLSVEFLTLYILLEV